MAKAKAKPAAKARARQATAGHQARPTKKRQSGNRRPTVPLEHKRHSLAHLLAASILELYPGAQNAIGPAIENGFYQDFDLGKHKVSAEDFLKIERLMQKKLAQWTDFQIKEVEISKVRKDFAWNKYKTELLEDFAKQGKKITETRQGDFLDLCKGGHINHPAHDIAPNSWKLDRVAGAYWRGDEKNKMLTRIYGLAFDTETELEAYCYQLEEAKRRDHKKLGKSLELFTFSPLVGPGLPLFLPKGAMIKYLLEEYMREEKQRRGYQFVCIPHIARPELYQKSGHLGKYDAMMPMMRTEEGDEFVLKAMNCPHHFEIYNSQPRSYRDLPLRLAENTTVYRNEKSGEVSGLLRVRSITQDDTHHFVMHEQIQSEIEMIIGLMQSVYQTFGFREYKVQISLCDPKQPEKYFDDELWQHAELVLTKAVKQWGVEFTTVEGEAAFYGPKIDIMVKDAIGRMWQLTTVQLDFSQPENFQMTYAGKDNKEHRPAVLHVAILGSTERFLGVLIEHFAGAFPVWLAPVQARVIAVSTASRTYAEKIAATLQIEGRRVEADTTNESVGKKIRNAELLKIPYMLVVGEKEMQNGEVNVRSHTGGNQNNLTLAAFQKKLAAEVAARSLPA